MSYEKHVYWAFDIGDGYPYAITARGIKEGVEWALVEETRKNGQEDCHCAGGLHRSPGEKWAWDVEELDCGDVIRDDRNFRIYLGDYVADGIRAFLDEHGRPGVEDTAT